MNYLVTGRTMSGKSLFIKLLLREAVAAGRATGVLDPVGDVEYFEICPKVTKYKDEFLADAFAPSTEGAFLVVDEAAAWGKNDFGLIDLSRRNRHWGNQVVFATQMLTDLSPQIRTNCACLVLFRGGPQAAKVLAEQYGEKRLEATGRNDWPKGDYLSIDEDGKLTRGNIFKDAQLAGFWRPR